MPNRIIKESICTSESISSLNWFEQVFFIRLLVTVDDYGRIDARPRILKGKLFPLEDVTAAQIENGLKKLSTSGMVCLYEVGGKPFLELTAWLKHNKPRATESKYPAPDEKKADGCTCEQMQADANICEQMQADVPDIRIRNSVFDIRNSDSVKSVSRATRFTPPTVEEVAAYCLERKNHVDPQRFVDFYAAKGWMVGKNRMKDWKAAVRTWEQREGQEAKPAPAKGQPSYSPPSNDLIAKFMEG